MLAYIQMFCRSVVLLVFIISFASNVSTDHYELRTPASPVQSFRGLSLPAGRGAGRHACPAGWAVVTSWLSAGQRASAPLLRRAALCDHQAYLNYLFLLWSDHDAGLRN